MFLRFLIKSCRFDKRNLDDNFFDIDQNCTSSSRRKDLIGRIPGDAENEKSSLLKRTLFFLEKKLSILMICLGFSNDRSRGFKSNKNYNASKLCDLSSNIVKYYDRK